MKTGYFSILDIQAIQSKYILHTSVTEITSALDKKIIGPENQDVLPRKKLCEKNTKNNQMKLHREKYQEDVIK